MKFLVICALLLVNNTIIGRELPNFDHFAKILGQLESNNNDFAIGDAGKALGRYQIWEVCFKDAKEYDQSITFSYKNLTNKENSNKVLKAYISRYARSNSFEEWARLWNSGPDWRSKTNKTNNYWSKFQKIMLAK